MTRVIWSSPTDWNEAAARALAGRESITLSDLHWNVIRFMRDYYEEHQVAPDARFVIKFSGRGKGDGRCGAEEPIRPIPLWLRQAGKQDRRHAQTQGLEHGVGVWRTEGGRALLPGI
jgi:DsrC like protein